MNKEEMVLFNDLWHIGTDMMSWDYKEPADELKEKIIKTFEENQQLQQKVNQLETNRDEAYKLLDNIDEYMLTEQHLKLVEAKKLLERGKE